MKPSIARSPVTTTCAAFAVCFCLVACSGHRESAPSQSVPIASHATAPSISIKIRSERVGSRYVSLVRRRKDNSAAYTLRADANVAESRGEGSGQSDFVNPHIIFSDRAGRKLIADAPHAVIFVKEKNLVMDGGVQARTTDGMTLRSDTLTYSEAGDALHGEGDVVVTTPRGERLAGDRIDANLHLSQMRISHVSKN